MGGQAEGEEAMKWWVLAGADAGPAVATDRAVWHGSTPRPALAWLPSVRQSAAKRST